jgi:hypothetical protein
LESRDRADKCQDQDREASGSHDARSVGCLDVRIRINYIFYQQVSPDFLWVKMIVWEAVLWTIPRMLYSRTLVSGVMNCADRAAEPPTLTLCFSRAWPPLSLTDGGGPRPASAVWLEIRIIGKGEASPAKQMTATNTT